MSIDIHRLSSLLNTATRDSTNDYEALQAARVAGRMVEAAGLSFNAIRFRERINLDGPLTTYEPANDIRQARLNAERERDEALAAAAKAEARAEELAEEVQTLRDHVRLRANPDGSLEWSRFYVQLVARNFETKGARTAFATHMKIPAGTLDEWQRKGTVPVEAVEALRTFKAKDAERHEWTVDQDILCGSLFERNLDVSEISAQLTARFGVRLNDGAVKKARQRANSRKFIIDRYEEGITDPDEITKRIQAHFPVNTGGARRSYVDKVLYHQYGILSPEEKARLARKQVATTTTATPKRTYTPRGSKVRVSVSV